MLASPATDGFDLLEHGTREPFVGPDQRLTRKLTNEEVGLIREAASLGMPPYRIWNELFRGVCSYHTVRRAANRQHYKEQP